MSTEPIKSGTSARAYKAADKGRRGSGGAAALRHMFPRVDAAETALGNRFDVYPGLSRARSVIQKLKYRLINGGNSFARTLS